MSAKKKEMIAVIMRIVYHFLIKCHTDVNVKMDIREMVMYVKRKKVSIRYLNNLHWSNLKILCACKLRKKLTGDKSNKTEWPGLFIGLFYKNNKTLSIDTFTAIV